MASRFLVFIETSSIIQLLFSLSNYCYSNMKVITILIFCWIPSLINGFITRTTTRSQLRHGEDYLTKKRILVPQLRANNDENHHHHFDNIVLSNNIDVPNNDNGRDLNVMMIASVAALVMTSLPDPALAAVDIPMVLTTTTTMATTATTTASSSIVVAGPVTGAIAAYGHYVRFIWYGRLFNDRTYNIRKCTQFVGW